MNELLPALYDHLEPVALRIARRAAACEPIDAQRAYLIGVSRQIVAHGSFRAEAPSAITPPGLEGTLGWFKLLDAHLDDFLAGRVEAGEIIAEGGGRLWETFQARDLVCAVFGHGVARALAPMLPGADVLELGTGTGGTTRRMAADLPAANRVVLSDLRQSFLDRVVAELPGVAAETAIVDINQAHDGLGPFDLVFSTNCIHVAKDLPTTLGWIRRSLKPGGALVLGEGAHYAIDCPSPVSVVLSLFNGWWDVPTNPARPQPGFLLPEHWFAAFRAAGFQHCSMERWTDGRRTFGGVYWAFA
ncbi:MAG TPA: methyltransferase domain-containing protein [Acidimicrobiia bacterium]|nr:methyltransferase domain-containing protein [Acidimicrobiia bacterium]